MPEMGTTTRIISGRWKGRQMTLPVDDAGVRPSKNRVRQAAFNLLNSRVDLPGLRVVDLCAGSGAWGLEAASRGAGEVVLVDVDVALCRRNCGAIGPQDVAIVLQGDALVWQPSAPFDVVLADPPYAGGLAQRLLARRDALGHPGSWWVVETGVETELDCDGFEDVARRDYGRSRLWVMRQG